MLRGFKRLFQPKPALELQLRELQSLMLLTPNAFELAVCDLLTEMGFKKVKQTGGRGDLGVDITAKDEKGRSVGVQCKRYAPTRAVGSRELQLFIGMTATHHKVDRAIYVTTARFTRDATELARKHKIELIDGDELTRLLLEHRGEPTTEDQPLEFRELLELSAAGVIDMDKIEFRLPEQDAATFVRETQEDLELLRQMEEEEARLYGGPPPGQAPLIDASSIGAPPEPCWRCGAQMVWDYDTPGFHCHNCGRRLALVDGELRVVETGGCGGSVTPISPPAMVGPEIRGPEDSTVVLGAPRQCPNCGEQMEYVISLPGYHCWICGRGEMVVNERLTVLTPGAENYRTRE